MTWSGWKEWKEWKGWKGWNLHKLIHPSNVDPTAGRTYKSLEKKMMVTVMITVMVTMVKMMTMTMRRKGASKQRNLVWIFEDGNDGNEG